MIVPIVNETNVKEAKRKLEMVKAVSTRVQIDVVDGLFADRLTIGPKDLVEYDFEELSVEYQLMVDDPTEWIEECVEAKAKKIIGHIERMGSQELFIEEVERHVGVEAGLGLEYATPLSGIELEALSKVKTILLLSVETGFNEGEYKEGIVEKIGQLRERFDGTIFVDGGMTPERYRQVIEAGATEAGASSYLWQDEIQKRMKEFV